MGWNGRVGKTMPPAAIVWRLENETSGLCESVVTMDIDNIYSLFSRPLFS